MDGGLDLLRLLIRAHGIEREDGGEGEGEDGLRQRVRQQRAHAAVLALILESMREDAQPQYSGASAETVAALPKTVVTHEWLAAQQDSARTCSLCLVRRESPVGSCWSASLCCIGSLGLGFLACWSLPFGHVKLLGTHRPFGCWSLLAHHTLPPEIP